MRYTKSVIAFFICATLSLSSSLAINYNRPEELKKINNTSISHIFQTDDNAIWFSTSDGLHRFNGKNLELMPNSGWKLEVAMGGGRYLWSIMSDGIYRIDGITRESGLIASTDGIDFTGCKCLAQGDSLLINSSNRLYCCNSDSLYIYSHPRKSQHQFFASDQEGRPAYIYNRGKDSEYRSGQNHYIST